MEELAARHVAALRAGDLHERRVARRFDRGLFDADCRALGIRREDADFYGPRALLYEQGWHTASGR